MGPVEFGLKIYAIIGELEPGNVDSIQKSTREIQELLNSVKGTDRYEEYLEIYRSILENTYPINTEPQIDYSKAINYTRSMKPEEKVTYLVQNLRMVLGEQRYLHIITSSNTHDESKAPLKKNKYRVQSENFRDEGKAIANLLERIHGDKVGMRFRTCPISEPRTEEERKRGMEQKEVHSFSIATIDDKKYIIDLAYRQFFALTHSGQEKDYIDAGIFMMVDERKRKVAEQILEQGFIEATPENFKEYMEGFVLMEQYRKNITVEMPSIEFHESFINYEPPTIDHPKTDYSKRRNFIIDSNPYIQTDYSDEYTTEMTTEEILTSIVQKERRYLMKNHDLIHEDLGGACEGSTKRIMLDCTSKGLDDAVFLSPGCYLDKSNEDKKTEGHNCTVVNINGKNYLIDCTYRQFFVDETKDKESHCGLYMINDDKRKKVAEQILKYGWVEATPDNIKAYMDGFEMAKRRSFEETGISGDEYIRRLAEHSQFPIHIVTSREIMEASIEREMTSSEIDAGGSLLVALQKEYGHKINS